MLRISKLTDYGTLILAHMAGLPDRVHSATGLAETLGLIAPRPNLSRYLAALKARPAYVKAIELGGPITLPRS